MSKSVVQRAYLLGSVAALALVGATTAAQAVETEFGEVQIIFDTTVSIGASMRIADREDGIPARKQRRQRLIRAPTRPRRGHRRSDILGTPRRSTP